MSDFFEVVHETGNSDISKKLQSIVDSNFKSKAKRKKVRNVIAIVLVLVLISIFVYNFKDTITGLTVEDTPTDSKEVIESETESELESGIVGENQEQEVEDEIAQDETLVDENEDEIAQDETLVDENEDEIVEEVTKEIDDEEESVEKTSEENITLPEKKPEAVDGKEPEEKIVDKTPKKNVTEEKKNKSIEKPEREIIKEPELIKEPEILDEPANVTIAPKLIKEIPNFEFNRGGFIIIDVKEYFSNADEYYFLQVEGISSTISENLILIQAEGGFDGTRRVNIIAENSLGSVESNFFDVVVIPPKDEKEENITTVEVIDDVNVSTSLRQYKAVINRPTKWIKTVDAGSVEKARKIDIELPKGAKNISVKTGLEVQEALSEADEFDVVIDNADRKEIVSGGITGNVAYDVRKSYGILTRFFNWLRRFTITGGVISEEELSADITETADKKIVDLEGIVNETLATQIGVEYYTDGPTSVEEIIKRGKRVVVSGDDALGFIDVLAFVEIPEKFKVGQENRIKVYWREQNEYVDFSAFDLDGNGFLDYVEWITPHLSNQTYDIILITKAEHLDSNREFISDIFEEVKELDGNWSEEIPNQHYVRVTFERNLTKERDITIYPRTITGNPSIEVYEVEGSELIAEFASLNDNEYNKVYLEDLVSESQDTFDLKIVGGSVEIEHIIDPPVQEFYEDCTSFSAAPGVMTSTGSWTENAAGGSCQAKNTGGVEQSLTSQTINLAGESNANLTFSWDVGANFESGEYLRVYANSSVNSFTIVGGYGGSDSAGTGNFALENNITLDAWVHVRFGCLNDHNSEDCLIDNINVTSYPVPDNEYPIFYGLVNDTANNTAYVSNAGYGFNVSINSTNGTVVLDFNGTNYTANSISGNIYNVSVFDLGANDFTYYWLSWGNGTDNNYNVSSVQSYTVAKSGQSITPLLNGANSNLVVTYPQQVNASYSGTNQTVLTLTVNGTVYIPGNNITLGSSGWVANFSMPTNQNYTGNESTLNITVNQDISIVNLTINMTEGNITVESGTTLEINGSTIVGDTSGLLVLYKNGTIVNVNQTLVSNNTLINTVDNLNITVIYNGSQNYSSSSETYWINVTPSSDVAPVIEEVFNLSMTDVASGLNAGPTVTTVTVNFSVYDGNGAGDLNGSSANLNFTKSGEELRYNSTCSVAQSSSDYVNYTCDVDMFWWDSAGTWEISARVTDNSSNTAINSTTVFQVGSTTGFSVGPTALTFGGIASGATNRTSDNDPMTFNNTGNVDISLGTIGINSTDLVGESDSNFGIWTENISVSTFTGGVTECNSSAISMNTSLFSNVSHSILNAGNFSLNNGTEAQEELYFCIRTVGNELPTQQYSTQANGAWTIRVLLAALAAAGGEATRRKRRKKKDNAVGEDELLDVLDKKLKEKYSVSLDELLMGIGKENIGEEDVKIPLAIFEQGVGAGEALYKYLKENKEMKYNEIAKLLNRDDRTVWTSYQKAKEKMKDKLEIKKSLASIPSSIFRDRRLTPLEALVLHLKSKGLKYSKIAEMIGRDTRNVWNIYSKAVKKLKGEQM